MKLYVYCAVEDVTALKQPPQGISNSPVRLLPIDNLAVLVSELDTETVPITRDNALAHAAVVRSVLDRTTPLPFRFGTLVTEQQLQSYISHRRQALETNLGLVRDCIEMSVKIIWSVASDNEGEKQPNESERGAGARFLEERRQKLFGDERKAAEAAEISDWLHASVSVLARDERITMRPSEKLVLAAAYLVERTKMGQFRDKIAEAAAARPKLHFLLSGPWPPYSFANIELEFKTRFGVS
ncbi:MAG TPA: GvpL/GvpF family gas vesicle protein [Pyrinomonadaceae bacterium]|nr:GvpL/GvpF family gas vesicle protein [Pyrinomonadaceae bacterium]